LAVREDPKRGVTIANLSVHHPADAKHLIKMIEFGNNNRAKQATDANSQSSRSHAIFQLYLKKQEYNGNQQMCIQLSKMSLIDLAGSERASVAYKENRNKSLQREGSNINKSLLSLGNCINALANLSKKKMTGYVPYRDSKLTLLLRDSLGGNCFTAMIAAISPTSLCFEDTHNTLNYAKRAKGIEFNVSKKTVSVTLEPHHYAKALEAANKLTNDQKDEIAELKKKIAELLEARNSVPDEPITCERTSVDILNRYKNTLTRLFEERSSLRLQCLETQSEIKKIDLKIMFKKIDLKRIRTLDGQSKEDSHALVTDDDFSAFHAKRENCVSRMRSLQAQIDQNEAVILQLESQLRSQVEDDDLVINAYFSQQHTTCEFNDKRLAEKHSNQIAGDFLTRFEHYEDLIMDSMQLHNYVQGVLGGMGRLSDGLQEKFNALRRKVDGKKKLVWRDDQLDKRRQSVYEQHSLTDVFVLGVYESKAKTPAKPESKSHLTSIYSITPSYS
jgi:kinesin family protein 18/19